MAFSSFLSKIFGNKSQRDLREIQPILDKIKAEIPKLTSLSNDELRGVITNVREDIRQAIAADNEFITNTKKEIETLPFDKRQPLWDDIDKHEKKILDTIEDKLNEHLPVVFAAIRETASRFAANETVEVTASQMDRDLAAQGKDFVTIDGDKAIYKNRWVAGGNEIVWDMVHYEVQLIGGIVLHQGKIARWLLVKVRHLWRHSLYFCVRSLDVESMLSQSMTICQNVTRSGWAPYTCSTVRA